MSLKRRVGLAFLLFAAMSVHAWRSSLYPENWTPGYADTNGCFLHDFSYAAIQQAIDDAGDVGSMDDQWEIEHLGGTGASDDHG